MWTQTKIIEISYTTIVTWKQPWQDYLPGLQPCSEPKETLSLRVWLQTTPLSSNSSCHCSDPAPFFLPPWPMCPCQLYWETLCNKPTVPIPHWVTTPTNTTYYELKNATSFLSHMHKQTSTQDTCTIYQSYTQSPPIWTCTQVFKTTFTPASQC